MESQVKRIESIERAPSSMFGNPAYHIAFSDGSGARTMANAGFAYEVGNPKLREGCLVVVQFTRAGRIRHMAPAEDQS